ncbi:MAG: SAM-dependent chlorinase/fluorinase [Phycisphaerae bacterium]|nr:SAM-dependent chlorinase/fluorinase [Phycisphaerae bacterium]
MAIVTLTTDFGQRDHYVAAMKGVILQIAPKTTIVDVTHHIDPHNVLMAAFIIRQTLPYFPRGTIHVVVVDPGVGTSRRIIAAQYLRQLVICPDNGVLSFLQRDVPLETLREVANRGLFATSEPSSTFHGRDVMAPVAAHLSGGKRLTEIGPATDKMEMLDLPLPERRPDRSMRGEIVYVDGFGNLVTNLTRDDLGPTFIARPHARVLIDGKDVGPVRQAYGQVEPNDILALIGSIGNLEIAVNQGSAAKTLGAGIGTPVVVE